MTKIEYFDAFESYTEYMKMIQFMLKIFGFGVFDKNFKFRLILVVPIVGCTWFNICMLYTIWVQATHKVELLKCLCVIGVTVQYTSKSTTILYYCREMYEMHVAISDLHENCKGKWKKPLYEWTKYMILIGRVQLILYFSTGVLFVSCPLIIYVLNGELLLVIPINIPAIDPNTDYGFTITTMYGLLMSAISILMLYAVDGVFLVFCCTAAAYLELVQMKCEHFSEEITKVANYGEQSRKRRSQLLTSTVISSQKAFKFISNICEYFEIACLIQIYIAGLSLALCVFTGRISTWFVAYPLGLAFLYNILIFSFIGTIVEEKSKDLQMSIYNINWHYLSPKERKTFLIMLQYSQRSVAIKLVGSKKLNLETGIAILKSIYSGYMMLESLM